MKLFQPNGGPLAWREIGIGMARAEGVLQPGLFDELRRTKHAVVLRAASSQESPAPALARPYASATTPRGGHPYAPRSVPLRRKIPASAVRPAGALLPNPPSEFRDASPSPAPSCPLLSPRSAPHSARRDS